MNKQGPKLFIYVCLWATISLAGFGTAVWQLWNNLMPSLFGLATIGYWQACGLMGLCWLLFGGWRWPGLPPAERAREVTTPMTEQERNDLRERLKDCKAARQI